MFPGLHHRHGALHRWEQTPVGFCNTGARQLASAILRLEVDVDSNGNNRFWTPKFGMSLCVGKCVAKRKRLIECSSNYLVAHMEELQLNFPIRMHSYLIISIPEESDMLLFTGLL